MLHVTCTAVGFCVGYLAHRYEENAEERVKRLMEKHRHVPPHDDWTQSGRKRKTEVSHTTGGMVWKNILFHPQLQVEVTD